MEKLIDFAYSIPDFRRTGKGNHRHELGAGILPLALTYSLRRALLRVRARFSRQKRYTWD